jgi:hypothetical protein
METWIRAIHDKESNLPINRITLDDDGTKFDLLEILEDTDPFECSEIKAGDYFNLSTVVINQEGICNIGIKVARVVPCIEFTEKGEGKRSQWIFVELIDLPEEFNIW